MKAEKMKKRVKIQLTKMGYEKEAEELILKYWEQTQYLKTARQKAEYMIA